MSREHEIPWFSFIIVSIILIFTLIFKLYEESPKPITYTILSNDPVITAVLKEILGAVAWYRTIPEIFEPIQIAQQRWNIELIKHTQNIYALVVINSAKKEYFSLDIKSNLNISKKLFFLDISNNDLIFFIWQFFPIIEKIAASLENEKITLMEKLQINYAKMITLDFYAKRRWTNPDERKQILGEIFRECAIPIPSEFPSDEKKLFFHPSWIKCLEQQI